MICMMVVNLSDDVMAVGLEMLLVVFVCDDNAILYDGSLDVIGGDFVVMWLRY